MTADASATLGPTPTGAAPAEAPPAATPPDDASTGARPPRHRRRHLWLVVAAIVVGGVLRIAIGILDDAPSTDEAAYLSSGESLVEGRGFEREGRPELHFPPFVPFLLGVAGEVVGDPHTGAVWVTILAGTALLVPLALLARRIGGPRAAVVTAWTAALVPGLATMPPTRGSGSEVPYALLVVTALWLVVASADHRGRARLLRVAGAGLLLGFAYLSRPEGLLIAAPLGAATVLLAWWRAGADGVGDGTGGGAGHGTDHATDDAGDGGTDAEAPPGDGGARGRWHAPLAVGVAFAVPLLACVAPYAAYLHDHTGSWQLTAKTQDVSLDAWHAVARGDRHTRDQILYALDDTGLHFPDDRSSLVSLARDDPAGYLGILATNIRTLAQDLSGTSLVPLPVTLLAVAGAWRLRRSRAVWVVLAVAALPAATALAFFVMPRYLVVLAALLTVLAGVGAAQVEPALPSRLRSRLRLGRPAVRAALAAGAAVLLAVPSAQAFHGIAGWGHPADLPEQRLAGEWIEANTAPDARIMARSLVVSYYAERPTVATPYAGLDQIVAFARHYGVRYVVVDGAQSRRMRPQLVPLLTADEMAGLRLVHEASAEGRTSRVFALDPPPPPTAAVGPSLGFMGDGAA